MLNGSTHLIVAHHLIVKWQYHLTVTLRHITIKWRLNGIKWSIVYSVYFACMYHLLPMYQIQEVNALLARGSNYAVFQIENAKFYLCGKTTVLRILRL